MFVDPRLAFSLQTKVKEIMSHFASHRMAQQDHRKVVVLFIQAFHFFNCFGQVAIPRLRVARGQSPAANKTVRNSSKRSQSQIIELDWIGLESAEK